MARWATTAWATRGWSTTTRTKWARSPRVLLLLTRKPRCARQWTTNLVTRRPIRFTPPKTTKHSPTSWGLRCLRRLWTPTTWVPSRTSSNALQGLPPIATAARCPTGRLPPSGSAWSRSASSSDAPANSGCCSCAPAHHCSRSSLNRSKPSLPACARASSRRQRPAPQRASVALHDNSANSRTVVGFPHPLHQTRTGLGTRPRSTARLSAVRTKRSSCCPSLRQRVWIRRSKGSGRAFAGSS